MIDLELYKEQLQAVLVLFLLMLLFCLARWLFSFQDSNSPIHMVNNVVGNHHSLLYFEPVNINSATLEELDLLPGVGQKTAQAILNLRQEHGFFLLDEELKDAMAEAHLPRRHLNALVGCYLTARSLILLRQTTDSSSLRGGDSRRSRGDGPVATTSFCAEDCFASLAMTRVGRDSYR